MAIDDSIIALGDTDDDNAYDNLAGTIKGKFQSAENARQFDEQRWLRAYRNYRGLYGNDMQFTESEKSKVFVKITKTKVMAAYGQIIEVLFSSGKFPLGIDPTTIPEDIAEYAHVSKSQQPTEEPEVQSPYGFPGDGNDLEPGATFDSILGGLKKEYEGADFVEGPSKDARSEPQINPAEISAKNMEKLVHDQLTESSATSVFRHSLFEMALLGTGIIKGPFSYDKTSHKWEKDEAAEAFYPAGQDPRSFEEGKNIVLINSGAAIYLSGLVDSLANGVQLARDVIESGAAMFKLREFCEFTQQFDGRR